MFRNFKNVKSKNMKATKSQDGPLMVKLLTAGTAACTADLVTFPLDVAKVRLQVQGEGNVVQGTQFSPQYKGIFHTMKTIVKEEGPRSLYNGLSAGLQRQMCFASIRIGLYDTVKSFYQKLIAGDQKIQGPLDVLLRICAGSTTGGLAVVVAQPTDVVKVRFQAAQGKEQRYRSTTEAYKTIFKVEGVRGLWKGAYPNIARNSAVNVSEIVCYDMVKDTILQNHLLDDNVVCHFVSAVIAGFCTTVVSSPVDVIKTRYMNSPPGQYTSAINCAVETMRKEGPFAFYKGFTPSFYRLVSWNIVMWVSYEQLKFFVSKIMRDDS